MTRRRRPLRVLGAALLYFGFAFVSPLALVAGPLALLLLLQHTGRRERVVGALLLLAVLAGVGAARDDFARFAAAWVLLLMGATALAVVLRPPQRYDLVATGLFATGGAALAGLLLVGVTSFSFAQLQWGADHHFGRQIARVLGLLFAGAAGADPAVLEGLRQSATATVRAISLLLPALVMLQSVAALAAAWALYRVVAREPLGGPVPPLREFRFNDHLVWGVVLALLALVLPGLDALRVTGGNLGAFFGGLYVARGLAVVSALAAAGGMSGPLAVILGLLATVLLLPLVAFTALALGVSDTWVDWRRLARMAREK